MESQAEKKLQVRSMFNNIATKYDFLNHFLSAGIDYSWRRKAIRLLAQHQPNTLLDVATGTADLAIEAARLNPLEIVGIDIAVDMLEIGQKKVAEKKLEKIIRLEPGDSEDIHFDNGSFDAVMVAFGVRNFSNLDKGLSEMFRVLKNGGVVVILEFSKPKYFGVKQIYDFYFRFILPVLGRMISGDKSAYTYLPQSVGNFPAGVDFLKILEKTGFSQTSCRSLSIGVAFLYSGIKRENGIHKIE